MPYIRILFLLDAIFYFDFFATAALAFAAFFLLLLIITIAKKVPTTVDANSVRMTGIRMA